MPLGKTPTAALALTHTLARARTQSSLLLPRVHAYINACGVFSQQERAIKATPLEFFASVDAEISRNILRPAEKTFSGERSAWRERREMQGSGICERGIREFSRARDVRSNNSPDAPPRSLVTRTVRAFYSARGHSPVKRVIRLLMRVVIARLHRVRW